MRARHRSFTLLLVLTGLVLAGALITPLALLSGSEALQRTHEAWALKHKLAGDSLIQLLPHLLGNPATRRELDKGRGKRISLRVGDVQIEALLQDDCGKIPLDRLARCTEVDVDQLAGGMGLPALARRERCPSTQCFEDVLAQATDREIFGTVAQPGWIAVATPLPGPVNVRSAAADVLDALLADVDRDLGRKLAEQRRRGTWETLEELLATLELTQAQRSAALRRLAVRSGRYSLLIETRIQSDLRARYVIVHDESPPLVVVDWEVSP